VLIESLILVESQCIQLMYFIKFIVELKLEFSMDLGNVMGLNVDLNSKK